MVRITSAIAGFLALLTAAEACQGWYQCKYSDGSHCCVIDSGLGPSACPTRCNGGSKWQPECIGQVTGNSRTECSCDTSKTPVVCK